MHPEILSIRNLAARKLCGHHGPFSLHTTLVVLLQGTRGEGVCCKVCDCARPGYDLPRGRERGRRGGGVHGAAFHRGGDPVCCWRCQPVDRRRGFVAGATNCGLMGGGARALRPCGAGDQAERCHGDSPRWLGGTPNRHRPWGLLRYRRRRERGAIAAGASNRQAGGGGARTVQNVRSSLLATSASHSPAVSSPPCSCRRCA